MKFRLLAPSTGRAIALCVSIFAALSSSPLIAQINFNDFSNTSGLQFNGAAAQATNRSNQKVLRLTPIGSQQAVAGSAFFKTPQNILNGFTSTFTFQVAAGAGTSADGIAFVVQNSPSGATALGATGGAIGYGQGTDINNNPANGIQYSLAAEFDTYQNAWGDPDNDHVALQSCAANVTQPGTPNYPGGNNEFHESVDANFNPVAPGENAAFNSCTLGYGDGGMALVSLGSLTPALTIADGNPHTATVEYSQICNGEICHPSLDVVIDGQDLFPNGIDVDLNAQLNLNGGNAYVGFTGGTGTYTENGDILNWTFTPHTPMTITLPTPPGQTTVFSFGAFNFKSTPDLTTQNGNVLTVTASPIPAGTGVTFTTGPNTATCIAYGSTGGNCETFEITCTGPDCGGTYDAEFATSYDLARGQPSIVAPGFGKDHVHACPASGPLTGPFTNQIDGFFVQRIDPTTKARSGGTASCWVATQNTPGISSNGVSNFIGFNAPVNNGAVNLATAGQTVPLTFEVLSQTSVPVTNLTLCTLANPSSCPSGSVDIMDYQSTCSVDGDTSIGAVIPADAAGASGLQNMGGGAYQYNWKTVKSWSGTCRTVQVNLLDGINHIAVFKFK